MHQKHDWHHITMLVPVVAVPVSLFLHITPWQCCLIPKMWHGFKLMVLVAGISSYLPTYKRNKHIKLSYFIFSSKKYNFLPFLLTSTLFCNNENFESFQFIYFLLVFKRLHFRSSYLWQVILMTNFFQYEVSYKVSLKYFYIFTRSDSYGVYYYTRWNKIFQLQV